jgi:hypothetical protein
MYPIRMMHLIPIYCQDIPSGLIKYIGLSAKELNGFVNTNIFRTRQILNFLKDGVNLGAV